ncbi:hypothetical protein BOSOLAPHORUS_303 [Erwinia phage vB_EamM_Bosolaphorus]|uniref:Uncharacterized protein n=1 Tax=Erwinia phage vB_EamM_Bosolaphorus TaxID=2060126 RepID=A0A2H5BIF0_9CAUD|nr:hypothetical protein BOSOLAPHORUS_303 [Erwinia phage vB_EamM_Bosolaphorus]
MTDNSNKALYNAARLPVLYEYPHDFTPHARLLANEKQGAQPSQAFAEMLAKVTGDPWTLTPKQPYTLYGAKVTLIGENQPNFPTSKRFPYVLVLQLSTRYQERKLYLSFKILKSS